MSGQLPVEPRIHCSSARSRSLSVALARERVPVGDGGVHRVVEDVRELDALADLARVVPGRDDRQRDVEVAGAQQRHAVVGLGGVQLDLDAGMRHAERSDRLGHERRAGARERAQAHATGAQARDRLELGLGVGQPREDRVGVERRARGRRRSAARRGRCGPRAWCRPPSPGPRSAGRSPTACSSGTRLRRRTSPSPRPL